MPGSPGMETDLDRLTFPRDGWLDEVHTWRNQAAADLVHMVVHSPSPFGGIAWVPLSSAAFHPASPTPFGVTQIFNATHGDALTFAHELGHNMGLQHDRYTNLKGGRPLSGALRPYAFGYVNQRALSLDSSIRSLWRTVMAYTAQCTDAFWWVSCRSVAGFSNPALTVEGDPFGVPGDVETNGLNGPANAVRLLNETAVLVANYRVSSRSATPLPTSGEPVGAATVTGIRAAVNDVRDRCGLAAASWTDPDIQRNVTPVRAVHITEPRAALAEAYRACRRTLPSWTDPGLGPGTRVKAVHSSELLEAAAALQP